MTSRAARTAILVAHMREAATQARAYVADMDKSTFLADKRTQQAVVMNLIILGEAATKLADGAPTYCAEHRQIPWNSMRGMRNRLAHGYFAIDLDVVWETVQSDLPVLLTQLATLPDLGENPRAP